MTIKKGTVDLTVGSPTKNILKFSLPLLLGNVFQLFYSWTDAAVIGQKDPLQFGALSACMPVINLLLTVLMGFLAGAVVIIGQYFGKKDIASLRRCYSTIIWVVLGISLSLMIIGSIFSKPLLYLLKINASQIEYANTYLTYYFIGCIFMAFYNCFAQVLRAIGNSRFPLYALIVCVLLNVGLDFLFVRGLNMNIEGVAIGTMISQAISAFILFIYIQKKVDVLSLKKADMVFDKIIIKQILKVALPSMIQQACACIGFMYINSLINRNGDTFTTAFGVGNRIDELMNMQFNSFGIALTNFAAQNKGYGNTERIKQGFRATTIITITCLVITGSSILIFKDFLIRFFIGKNTSTSLDIEKVIEIAHTFLGIYVPSYFLMATMVITSGCLRGCGDAKAAMSVNIFSLCIRVTAAFILTTAFPSNAYLSLYGVFFASPIGWLAGTVWAIIRYKQGRWERINVIK